MALAEKSELKSEEPEIDPTEGRRKGSEKVHFRIELSRVGRAGKVVTLLRIAIHPSRLPEILQILKGKSASGGTIKDGAILLQGNQINLCRKLIPEWLQLQRWDREHEKKE